MRLAVVAAVATAAASAPRRVPPQPFAGYVFDAFSNDTYLEPVANASMQALAATGVRVVEIVVTQYLTTTAPHTDTNIHPVAALTPTDAALRAAIAHAHQLGIAVALKPHVDSLDGVWRGEIAFNTSALWNAWWSNYTAFITHYATLAADSNVEFFNVGTELDSTESQVAGWRATIAAVRAVFNGPLWYGCV